MAGVRNNSEIIKGSKLMVFMGHQASQTSAVSYDPVGFATSHTFNGTTNTTEISSKDHGDYPSTLAQSLSWEITAENLFSDKGADDYIDAWQNKKEVKLQFTKASNYNNQDEKGVIGDQGHGDWGPQGNQGLSGTALITNVSVNAPAGDNGTLSVTFTGVGPLGYQAFGGQH